MRLIRGIAFLLLISTIWHCCLILMITGVNEVYSVHGHQYIRKTAQQRQNVEMDTDLEEELDEEAEEEIMDRLISTPETKNTIHPPLMISQQHMQQARQSQQQQQEFDKDSVFEQQGETRDFLYFLRRIRYDHRQCPQNEGKPVLISVSVVVSNVRAVSEVTMDYNLEMFYRESWVDERLRYNIRHFRNKTVLALHESYANFLWHPDTFMPNAIASKNPRKQSISHRSLLRLQSDGQILYSRRLSVVAECPMDLTLFPFDSQTCKLGIESYGYTSEQVHYGWSHGQRAALKLHKIRLPDFRIKEAFVTSQLESYATGNYSRLYVCFVFSRSAGFCFLQLIIPSTAVVITSWVSLWLENETSFQDMISIILTITFLLFSYNEVMPRVSYLKALDIWLAVCFMIVFLSLIKLAIMKYMRQRLKMDGNSNSQDPNALLAAVAAGMLQNQLNDPQCWIANGTGMLPFPSPNPFPSATRARHQQVLTPHALSRIESNEAKKSQQTASSLQTAANAIRRSQMDLHQQQNCFEGVGTKVSKRKNNKVAERNSIASKTTKATSRHKRRRSPSAESASCTEQQQQQSAVSSGIAAVLTGPISQLLTHQAMASSTKSVGKEQKMSDNHFDNGHNFGDGGVTNLPNNNHHNHRPYQPPISTLAATALHLPLCQSSLRQLQHQQLCQLQQQLRLQLHLQQSQLIHQAQLCALREQRNRERQRRKDREQQQQQNNKRRRMFDANQNEMIGARHPSAPNSSICIGIESNDSSTSTDENNDSDASQFDEGREQKQRKRHLFFCFDQFGNVEFTAQFMRRFHWISQMSFFFGFVLFCLYFFLVYPNSRSTPIDPACRREEAQWFASIPI